MLESKATAPVILFTEITINFATTIKAYDEMVAILNSNLNDDYTTDVEHLFLDGITLCPPPDERLLEILATNIQLKYNKKSDLVHEKIIKEKIEFPVVQKSLETPL